MDHLPLLLLLWCSGLRAQEQHNQRSAQCETTEKADIVMLLVDRFSHIRLDEFQIMKSFVAGIVSAFNIGPDTVQIGLDQDNGTLKTEWHLNTHQSKQSLLDAIDKLRKQKGGYMFPGPRGALEYARHHYFNHSVGMQTDSKNILVLITEEHFSFVRDDVYSWHRLKNSGVEIYVICVGCTNGIKLRLTASQPTETHSFTVSDFHSLLPITNLVTINLCNSIKKSLDSVRLVNGPSLCSGSLEVKSNQSWSSVCEDDFDQWDAEVVCRELDCGAPSVLQGALYGEVEAPMWTKEFQCEGNESALMDCRSSGSARNTCSPAKAVGLTCSEPVRLVGGSSRCAGTLELKRGEWRPVYFTDWMGAAVCIQLNCGDFVSSRGRNESSLKSALGIDHECGSKYTLKECAFPYSYSSIIQPICSEPVRLVGGSSRCAGTLEVKRGEWRPGYGNDWTLKSAAAVCRALDCGSVVSTQRKQDSSITSAWKIFSRCLESESAMSDCFLSDSSSYITELTCSESVRLVNGPSLCSGRLEVKSNQSWSSVCEDDFDQRDAEVVCRELDCGAPSVLQGALYGEVKAPMWTKEFQCEGNESALMDCTSSGSARNTCSPGKAVGLTCSEPVRLVGGSSRCAGTLELKQGEWRPVHDFSMTTAAAVCRELDCGSSVFTRTRQDSSNRSTWEISSYCFQSGLALKDCVSSASSSSIMELTCSDPVVFFIRLVLVLLALLLFISLICYSYKAGGRQPAPQENIEMDYYNLGVSGAEGGLAEGAAEEEPQTAPLTST